MSHERPHVFILLALCLSSGTTEGSSGPGEASAHSSRRADFKVAVWYRKADPLGTFKYEIYNVLKGEYTAKVDEWLNEVKTKYPGYYVVVRDVDLNREKGDTDLLKVGSVIDRELTIAAGSVGIVLGSGRRASRSPDFGSDAGVRTGRSKPAPVRLPGSSSRDRDYLTPAGTLFPVPVPFPHLPR